MSSETLTFTTATSRPIATAADPNALQTACVNLMCSVESTLALALQMPRGERVECAANTAENLLQQFLNFSTKFLLEAHIHRVRVQVIKGKNACQVHREVMRNCSWQSAMLSIFNPHRVDANLELTNTALQKSIARVGRETFDCTLELLGNASAIRNQIQQSANTLLKQLEEVW
jgi:hypothetical protein